MSRPKILEYRDECVQCGESKAAIRESQRKGGLDVLYCATVDHYGECLQDWERHRFIWTEADQASQEAEVAYWAAIAKQFEEDDA